MKHKFLNAWDEITNAYKLSRINSERTLQALFHSYLLARLPSTATVICEPTIELEKTGQVVPDILVLEGRQIAAVVELKFVPHSYPLFKDDLEKLQAYAQAIDHFFPLLLDPDSGHFSEQRFAFSSQCLLVFGVIGRHDAEALDQPTLLAGMAGLEEQFLPLLLPVGK